MKKRFLSVAAGGVVILAVGPSYAADPVILKGPPILAASGVNWSGVYGGVNFGVAKGYNSWSGPTGPILLATPRFPAQGGQNGIFGGATAGYNHQIGAWVFGIESDVSFATNYGNAVCGGAWGFGGFGWNCQATTDILASFAPRAGYAVGNALFYIKGGLGYARNNYAAAALFAPFVLARVGASSDRWGWTIGSGVEYALGGPWSAKAEYDYYNFSSQNWGVANVSQDEHLVKFGVNYRYAVMASGDASAPEPMFVSEFSGEFGGRIGYTTGRFDYDLWDPIVPYQHNSRLDWIDQSGIALEGFGRVDHVSGVFVKGMIGGNALLGSHMHDEDYPPGLFPYSNTYSATRNGNGMYGTADLGWAYRGPGWRLGGFLGYWHNEEQLHAYGCTQLYLSSVCQPPGLIPAQMNGLSRFESWNAMRIGVTGDYNVTDRLKVSADLAHMPRVIFGGHDNHWARPDINPLSDTDTGYGYQFEGVASYRVTERLSVGVGARYWYAAANGHTQFPFSPFSPTRCVSERTTVFAQTSYAFGGVNSAPVIAKY